MSQSQTAINARATRWLADILDRRGLANPHDLAQHITGELLAQGLAPVPKPFPIRPAGPVASEAARQAAKEAVAQAVARSKAQRGEVLGIPVVTDPAMPAGRAEIRSNYGSLLATLDVVDDQADVVHAVIHEADCPGGDCQCDDERRCASCGDAVLTLSSRDLCDGCEADTEALDHLAGPAPYSPEAADELVHDLAHDLGVPAPEPPPLVWADDDPPF